MAHEKILVVDDEPHIVQLCVQILTELGYRVQGTSNESEALTLLEAEAFDLLVTDVRMPHLDGLALLRRGLELDPNLAAIVITGYASLEGAIEALHAGARGFVLKPFSFEELAATVKEALYRRQKELERLRMQAQLPILEIGQTLMTTGDVESLARRLLGVVVRQMKVDRAALLLLDREREELRVTAAVGLPKEAPNDRRIPAGQGIVAQVLNQGSPLVLEGRSQAGLEPLLGLPGMEPGAAVQILVPLRTARNRVGILALEHLVSERPVPLLSPSERNLLSIMAAQIAIALENAQMYALEQQRAAVLARALERQRELDRLKDQLIRNVSHEFRTPLAIILGYAEFLASGQIGEMHAEQAKAVEAILERATALSNLVETITAILDNETREPIREPVFLDEIAVTAVAHFQLLAGQSGLKLHGEIGRVPPVLGNAQHLRNVVDNLIANALKFTPPGGTVTVSLGLEDNQVVLRVSDTGIGIGAEHLDRIFDRFYQVNGTIRRRYGGSGLGLALVKEITEAHGGVVTVESQPGVGSTFSVCLPAVVDGEGKRAQRGIDSAPSRPGCPQDPANL